MTSQLLIRWMEDADRVSALFVTEHERRFTVRYLNVRVSFNALEEDGLTEEIRKRIGHLLAGQPLGDTERILREGM